MHTKSYAFSADEALVKADLEKYRALGGWVEKPDDMQAPLDGDINADVVIIGAGFAGLSAALELASKRLNVVVLEREFAGFGASGRNAGYLAGAIGIEYELFHKKVSQQTGEEVVRYYEDSVTFVEGKLKEHGIECDYNQSGIIRAGIHEAQLGRLRKGMKVGAGFGFKSVFLDQAAMRGRGIPPAFLFGEYTAHGGTLHPGKYVMGLRRAAIRAGVRLYENTPLLSYAEGSLIKVKTPRGSVSAPIMLFASNAYTPQNGLLADKVVPLRVSAIETEPLTAAQLKSLGWHGREGIMTAHWIMESFRLTPHNTLLVTTKRVQSPYGSRTPNVPAYDSYSELRVALHDRLPTLKDIAVRACWSGYVSAANDALPTVGVTGANQNIYYTAGCSGHGVGPQSLMGHMLAEKILGSDNPLLVALRREQASILPEPLQWAVTKATLGLVNILDSSANRKARTA
jgi:glycine/D-amino acid oxidase-like deaminating enzyme